YDGAGRILGEDYAPCEDHHAGYSLPSGGTDYENLEVSYFYDGSGLLPPGVAPSGWTGSAGGGVFTVGRAVAVLDRGSASFTTYDGRGRTVSTQTRVAKPVDVGAAPESTIAARYAPRVYERSMEYDAADREVVASTGLEELMASTSNSSIDQFLSQSDESQVTTAYSARGAV